MYCNFAKSHTFYFTSTLHGQPKCRIIQNPLKMVVAAVFFGNGGVGRSRSFSDVTRGRSRDGKSYEGKVRSNEGKVFDDMSSGGGGGSSWGESASRYFSRKSSEGVASLEGIEKGNGFDGQENVENWKGKTTGGQVNYYDKPVTGGGGSSWGDSAGRRFSRNSLRNGVGYDAVKRNDGFDKPEKVQKWYSYNNNDASETFDETKMGKDSEWGHIKNRYNRNPGGNSERPEVRRWDNEENWGRNKWKEVTESTIPKMVGEGLYGVNPVLAALTVRRREFYALYVQENLDLSGNNRKKKDKKGIQKVLKIAEDLGLTVKETSKHDMNMIVDNRPHQGLVLDASPLEMVNIRELESVTADNDKGSLWLALDEVTDPQNLGAIIRSAYFFGAAGVVLCAKNSAPLSGVVSKASAGALELVELMSCKNMMQFLTLSSENGWRVLGGSVCRKAVPLNEIETGKPTILVLGSEGIGLRPLVESSCTQLIRIPGNILGNSDEPSEDDQVDLRKEQVSYVAVESLNVSVATGVLLYHLVGNTGKKGEIV